MSSLDVLVLVAIVAGSNIAVAVASSFWAHRSVRRLIDLLSDAVGLDR